MRSDARSVAAARLRRLPPQAETLGPPPPFNTALHFTPRQLARILVLFTVLSLRDLEIRELSDAFGA
jgi:hypothetical protein